MTMCASHSVTDSYCHCLTDGVSRQMMTASILSPVKVFEYLIDGVNFQADIYRHSHRGRIKRVGKK
jgi:hypothetical protein